MEAERAILVPRVSAKSNTQTEYEMNQLPGMQAYADSKGYIVEPDAIIPIYGKSAFHGRHLKILRAAIDKHVRNGNATVVIFRDVDRSSRQGPQATYDLRGEIIRAGGRMEFSGIPMLNDQRAQEGYLSMYAMMAREESEAKSRRQTDGLAKAQARGIATGKPAWGYAFGEINGMRSFVPTEIGKLWVPRIYQWATDGKSLRFIAEQITEAGIESPQANGLWGKTTIQRMIANPTYYGGRTGKGNLEYEALISVEKWQQANIAVQGRNRQGRNPVKRVPAFVVPFCGACYGERRTGAPSGKSPMRVSGKPTSRHRRDITSALVTAHSINPAASPTLVSLLIS